MKKCLLICFSLFILCKGFAQYSGAVFSASVQWPVLGLNGDSLSYPFAGGMNNCQYGSIDLNLDGTRDFVVFDRHGDRILTFINTAVPGAISYEFRPEYANLLPPVNHWMELVDYNGDGKEDVFTYTTGGIKVYRNESNTSLQFKQVSFPYLVSMQGSTLTNILVTYADYPAIADVDGDGDKDILTFWGLGSFVEWHRNMSEERYGTADSLEFVKSSNCWGRFAEGIESNEIKLDTCTSFSEESLKNSDPKHTGSTLLTNDFNGDGVYDIVIGDVDYPELISLTNGGTQDTAFMISQTTNFPNSIHPVNLISFPVACMTDVNNDGASDLIISPFDPSLVRSESSHSSWLYLNSGGEKAGSQSFQFIMDNFLQNQMLDFGSGAYPVLYDYDADGLQDLIIGNYGVLDSSWYDPSIGLQCQYVSSLALLKNIGSSIKPAFRLITLDYLGLGALKMQSLIPCLGDLDNDGDLDMVCGNSKGKLVYLENNAGIGQPANFILRDPAFQQIDVGDFSAPQLIDLDLDGLIDIVCGKRNGQLSYFRNTGTENDPHYVLVSDTLGGVDVTNPSLSYFGYSVPFFCKSADNKTTLLVGSEFGDIYVYTDIENNIEGKFTSKGVVPGVKTGWRSAVALGNIDNDNFPDLIAGNYSGGLNCFRGTTNFPFGIGHLEPASLKTLSIWPNPANGRTILDLNISEKKGYSVSIHSVDGRLITEIQHISFPYSLDISMFKAGIYQVQALSGNDMYRGRLVVIY
jgi:hypothetical protein